MQVVEGRLTAGELSSFVIYALYVGSNVGSLASVISNLIQVSPVPSWGRLCDRSIVLLLPQTSVRSAGNALVS